MINNLILICSLAFILTGCAQNNVATNAGQLSDLTGNVALAAVTSVPLSTPLPPAAIAPAPATDIVSASSAAAISTPAPPSSLPVPTVTPFANNILGENIVIAKCTTEFDINSKGRANNIKVGSKSIDEKIIQPGETFSFNKAVGPTNRWRGFKLAKIFIKGKEAKGYGGGICQVSSTLYNAALDSNMTIVERHPHSKRVYYLPEGRDAATSYGYLDLKFNNSKTFPVKINSWVDKNTLTVTLEKAIQ